ncbi:MAG TPA: hypothetical protein VN445_15075 [Rectinemataceae bacterium]|nr:hypothetical protein [Rectinemataceae bacterium]
MSKGAKAAIFVIVASLANILLTGLLFIACLGLYSLTLAKILPQTAVMWAVVVSFIASMAGTFVIYKKALAYAQKKFNLEEKLGLYPKKRRY